MVTSEWFNGTHLVRVTPDAKRALGVRVETCMADGAGAATSLWEVFSPDQTSFYREMAQILAEGYR